jgi:cobalt-zinc-cadmium efflux system membrane fusion protein
MRRVPRAVVLLVTSAIGCSKEAPAPAKAAPQVKVEHPVTEAQLTTVTLTPEAVTRLGIQSVAAKVESVAATRTLGGEVTIPEGRLVVVSAPVAGTLAAGPAPQAGAQVKRGDRLLRLVPLAPTERDQGIESDRELAAAQAGDTVARQRLQRLEQLLKDGAASAKAVEEARAQQEQTAAALEAARERQKAIARSPVNPNGEISITAPLSGLLQTVSAAPGQTVAAGAALFAIGQVETLWIRVPVFAGDVKAIDESQPVVMTALGSSAAPRRARRVVAPMKADPASATVDLFYELSQDGPPLRPGERVAVQVPLRTTETGLVVPESAVLYDIHGATWAYEDQGAGRFVRHRIEIERRAGDRAVVSRGLAAGTKVVTVGAAELFGTEFGAGK